MYELVLIENEDYLHVTLHDELNPTSDVAIDAEIRRECENRKARLVLIDIRQMSNRLDGIENHIAAITIHDRMGPYIRAIAVVDKSDHADRSEMYEMTAVNRGATMKFFENCEDATYWLRSLK